MSTARLSSRRRQRGAADRQAHAIEQMDWNLPEYIDRPTEPLDEETLQRVHETSMRVLEEIGILFLNEESLSILEKLGCDVDWSTQNVRIDRALVDAAINSAPAEFSITPRNPDHRIHLGGRHAVYSTVASAPNVSDLDGGRRVGSRPDFPEPAETDSVFQLYPLHCRLSG